MEKNIQITVEESNQIKFLFQSYNVLLNILKSLLMEDINDEHLDPYFLKLQNYGIELENLKETISKKYLPKEFKNIIYDYYLNFNDYSITYKSIDS